MELRKRAPGLVCLLLMTAALLLAGRHTPGAPPGPDSEEATATMEEDTIHYEEQPTVRVISLSEMAPADTAAEQVLMGEWAGFQPADPAEMAEVLSELYLHDGTSIRLYATAEGLVFGAFLRPGGQWTRFVQLYDGEGDISAFVQNLSLTPFSGILGKEGFLLRRTAQGLREHVYDYYWFDETGGLQVLRAQFDPVALDLDGDGTAELAYELAEWQSSTAIYCQDTAGVIYQVTPAAYIGSSHALMAVEREGPGPARLIYRCQEDGQDSFCAVTLENDQLRIEENIVYVPAQTTGVPLPADPTEGLKIPVRMSVAGPDGRDVEDAGEVAGWEFQSMLWEGNGVSTEGAVLTPTDAPLNEAAAYTVTFTPETGEALSWTLDDQGICRFSGMAGNYRMITTGLGSLPDWCHDTLKLYCEAARTSRAGGGT